MLLGVVVALAITAWGFTQEIAPKPGQVPAAATAGESILQALPKPPALPGSLFAPAPLAGPGYDPLDVPYFVPNPLVDPPQFPAPGWFVGLELDVLKPHLKNQLTNTVQNAAQLASGASTTVALPSSTLDWAAAPSAFVGYRLPAGFGEVALVYRGLATRGSGGFLFEDGLGTLTSRLDFRVIDLDYSSREFSLWPDWEMKWTFGARTLFLYFDSQAEQPFAQAAAGSGILQMRESNSFVGAGPHAGLELARHIADTGLSLNLRADFSTNATRIREGFATSSTNLGPDGQPLAGQTRVTHWGNTPIISTRVGLSWQPPSFPNARLFLGYQYEYWWRVGVDLDTGGRADMWDQGVVLQAAFRF
jgi:hypothetical protein